MSLKSPDLIKRFIKRTLFFSQQGVLFFAYLFFCLIQNKKTWSWAVGLDETANNIQAVSSLLPGSYSISFSSHPFYSKNKYNFSLPQTRSRLLNYIIRLIGGPLLLGYLASRVAGFFYVGSSGFLISGIDARCFEFAFLKRKGKKVVNFFYGSDIRSIKLSIQNTVSLGLGQETLAYYEAAINPSLLAAGHENNLAKIAAAAEKYADVIFTAPVDQISYFKREPHFFFYIYPDERFKKNDQKFTQLDSIIIVHAPSAPIIKGTQLVRAAIKKLQLEGYYFEYVELQNVSNEKVLETLYHAHIVLNQFYAFMPGLFAIEAMAAHCAVLTSADKNIEKNLPEGANEAWFLTRYWEVYGNLKQLLDNPELIKEYADRGFSWAYTNYRVSHISKYLNELLLQETGIGQ